MHISDVIDVTNELVISGLLLNLQPKCYEYKMVFVLLIFFLGLDLQSQHIFSQSFDST